MSLLLLLCLRFSFFLCLSLSLSDTYFPFSGLSHSDELTKPAAAVLPHHLAALLSTAVRGSNGQYDDSDTIARLDVRKLQVLFGLVCFVLFSFA